ncbi:metalloregulator ArsR/SmtB family transcription factor [Nocardia sp. CS682]|uniref:metalloregulator ArsR/SmtB family transcription factor n=1 Tax=Nocardia sp. CS682 TaxID=1047172 RepID=UPI001F0E30E0|nr:metalloregulator ArsR/SmtB family transcription factor [Nocardia sp. CS682]
MLLGDRSRRAIFEHLARGPRSVGELAELLPISRPAVSQHLSALRIGGLVICEVQGTRHVYRLNVEGVAGIRAYLDQIQEDALRSFRNAAEAALSTAEKESSMSTPASIPVISGTVTVDVPLEHAFKFFTESFGSWWPTVFHIGQVDMADGVIEPREGGRWFEKGVDGSECDWGRVIAWDPPNKIVLTWQINGMFAFDADPDHASEIEIRFAPEGPDQTKVDVEHRNIERLVQGQGVYDGINQGGGWQANLDAYAAALANK